MFGDSETDVLNDYDVESTSTFGVNGVSNDVEPNQNDWVLPHEAFQPRHEIKDRSPPPEHFQSQRCFADHKMGNHFIQISLEHLLNSSICLVETQTVQVEDQTSALLCLPGTHGTCSWNGTSNVVDMIYHLAEEGDVQTVVTLILILGDRIRNLLNDASAEHWFLSYIDTLHRFRLWNTAALVIKLSPYSSIQRMSHRSTNYCTNCPTCRQRTIRSGWMCDHCKHVTNTCSLCHLVVRGLYVWCRGCSHGGHLVHMQEWFTTNDACPTGCGHLCEFD
jgi:WD repeat-containing protein 24